MVRTYQGGSNYVIDSVLYEKTTNSTSTIRIAGESFIPTTCTLNIGDSTSGFEGTLSEFRIFTGTGAIPGMPWISAPNCPQGAGIITGTSDPCFTSCLDLSCIECSSSATCTACQQGFYLFINGTAPPSCLSTCPFGYMNDNTIQECTKCSSIGLLYFEASCVSSCPSGYVVDSNLGACVKCTNGLIYFNKTCVSSCPLTTYLNSLAYECQPCALGCDTCTGDSKYDCTSCSEGYFYSSTNRTCGAGCPSDKYPDTATRACENCQSPCSTCTQPNNLSCTSCPSKYYLLNGTCVTSCPLTYYVGYYGDYSSYRVPACIPKLILFFNLSLTSNPRVVEINFNYAISAIILPICNKIQIQIAGAEISSEFYSLTPISESTIKFEYVGDQYYAPFSILNVTLDLDSDFNTDEYQEYRTVNKSASLQLKEIYPFSNAETQTIVASANLTSIGGGVTAAGQVLTAIAAGSISVGLVRMQLISESIQLLRFIAIRWPPSVNQMFSSSTIDPTSIVIPLDLTTSWNSHLENRNSTMPRVFEEYEIGPYFTINYNQELSNIFIIGTSLIVGIILIRLSKKVINKTQGTNKHQNSNTEGIVYDDGRPPKNPLHSLQMRLKRLQDKVTAIIHKLVLIISHLQEDVLWNFGLMFTLSIYQPGMLWSLVNLRNASSALENSTFFTNGAFTLAVLFLTIYSLVMLFLTFVVMKYPLNAKEFVQQTYSKRYSTLFDDFENKKRLQIFFVPLLLLRSIIYMLTLSLAWVSPLAQMIVTWITFLAFTVYIIVYQPIKSKWQRRMTLWIELMAFGCITVGFICSIVDLTGDPDASTLNEIGFIVLAFNAGATIGGALTTLMQVLALVKLGYQYLRRRKQRRNAVQPINHLILPEPQLTADSPDIRLNLSEEKIRLFKAADSLFQEVDKFYKTNLEKSAETQFLEDRQHWKTTGKLKTSENEGTSKGRMHLFLEQRLANIGYSESSTPKIE